MIVWKGYRASGIIRDGVHPQVRILGMIEVLVAYSIGGVTGAGGPSRGRNMVNIGRGLHAAEGGTSTDSGRHS